MRCTILVLSLVIIYATASPISDIVPEDSLFSLDDDLSEAQTKIDEMTAAGKSDKDCRKLVTDTRTEITTNVGTCQKILDALPRGGHCTNLGQEGVKTATKAKTLADNHVAECNNQVTKAASASVDFGSRTYSSLTVGSCSTFYSSTAYTTAKTTYKAAVTAHTTAKGAAAQARITMVNAIAGAAKEKHDCLCKTKSDHKTAFAKHSAADAANQKAWKFALKLECVLDGKATCTSTDAPKCKLPRVTSAVMEEQCSAPVSKCPPCNCPKCANGETDELIDTFGTRSQMVPPRIACRCMCPTCVKKPCAFEGGTCNCKGTVSVKYGYGSKWSIKTKKCPVKCNNGQFGDPMHGQRKACWI